MLTRLTGMSRRVGRVRRGDAGITLTELVVTMSLMSIVGALALTAFVSTSDGSTRTTEANLTTAAARVTMSSWTDLLQVAALPDPARTNVRNLSITATTLSFNAQLGNLPNCSGTCATGATTAVTLRARTTTDGRTQLVQTIGDAQTVLVSSGVAALDQDCFFHPYGYDGRDLTCGTLAADSSDGVGRIDIAFAVTTDAGAVQQFRSSAKLPGATP